MASSDAWIRIETRDRKRVVRIGGQWILASVPRLAGELGRIAPSDQPTVIDVSGLEHLDTAGAWQIDGLQRRLSGRTGTVPIEGLAGDFAPLYERVAKAAEQPAPPAEPRAVLSDFVAG